MQVKEFKNLSFTDFSRPDKRAQMEAALAKVRGQLGREYDIIIGGRRIRSENKFKSCNPANTAEVIGVMQEGGSELVEEAVRAAEKAFQSWSRTSAQERTEIVFKMADIMTERRYELASWMVLEVGKSWVEADADVAEAVDFLNYYSHQMLDLAKPQPLVDYPPEENELVYIPLGVGAVISPWNFPLAILTGMTFAGIVAGNTVICKPAHDSAVIASKLMEIAQAAGLPDGVFNLLTGRGPEVGEPLVVHPRVRFISFTGSKEVGLRINELAAKPRPDQIWIKRVVAEMGGKDSIVVDEEADLDAAVEGVVRSSYGYQGQKCSACSRAIVADSIYDLFLEKLTRKTKEIIKEGDPQDPDVNFGPVVNSQAFKKISEYIEIGKQEGRLLAGGDKGDPKGYFIRPTIFADIDPKARLAQEEIFGPVLSVIRARDYDHALEIANNTVFGLTGAVYSKNPEKLQRAKREFHVGNLYLNRGCTGALVGIHPFGGFNMSGTDSKAGGPDYLLLFTQAKSIARLKDA
ncbi:MAG TPA: L-glutamate gamma-semialdehyde dehydrogenase [Acidobacteriota bacterium]|nr:L-glutamate gamma-semialdehyde dehydrogenase [Acidobacteriota bacterium]